MAVPLPNLTLAAPSQSTASGTLAPSFNIGSGSAGGIGIIPLLAIAAIGILVFKWGK